MKVYYLCVCGGSELGGRKIPPSQKVDLIFYKDTIPARSVAANAIWENIFDLFLMWLLFEIKTVYMEQYRVDIWFITSSPIKWTGLWTFLQTGVCENFIFKKRVIRILKSLSAVCNGVRLPIKRVWYCWEENTK